MIASLMEYDKLYVCASVHERHRWTKVDSIKTEVLILQNVCVLGGQT